MRFSHLGVALLFSVFSFYIDLAASQHDDDHDDEHDDLPPPPTYPPEYYGPGPYPPHYGPPGPYYPPRHGPPHYHLGPGPYNSYGDGLFPYLAVDAIGGGNRPGSFGSALLGGVGGTNFAPFVMATGGHFGLGGGIPGVLPYGHTDMRYWDQYRAHSLLGGNPGYQAGLINPFDSAEGSYNQWWLNKIKAKVPGSKYDPMVYQKFTSQHNPLGPMLGSALYGNKHKRKRRSAYHPAHRGQYPQYGPPAHYGQYGHGHQPYYGHGHRSSSLLDSLGLLALTGNQNGNSNINNNLAVLLAADGGLGGHHGGYGGHHRLYDPFTLLALTGGLGNNDNSGGVFGDNNNLAPLLLASGALRRPGYGGPHSVVPMFHRH